MKRLMMGLVWLAAGAASASAEEINFAKATAERPNLILARTGVDHALVVDVGYRRVLSLGGQRLILGGDFGVPWGTSDLGDYRVRGVVSMPLVGEGRGFQLVASLAPTLRASRNSAGTDHALGVDARLTAGYYARWWAAGELGIDWAATTHIAHDDAYLEVYPGARDGWYGNPGGTIYAGMNAGVTLRSVDLVLRAGMPRATGLGPQTLPFYALVGVNVTLPD